MSSPKNLMDILKVLTTPENLKNTLSTVESFKTNPGALLCHAASIGDINSLKLLLARGVSPDCCGIGTRSTPLMLAAYYGQTEAVKLLQSRGAQANLQCQAGWTALHYALKPEATANTILKTLSETDLKNAKDIAKLLLENKADPNILGTKENVHPLKLGAEFGDLEIVQLLIKFGAKEIADAHHLNGASHIALWKGKLDIFEYFVTQSKFPIDAKLRTLPTHLGRSLLHEAVLERDRESAEILVKQGADPNDVPLGVVIHQGNMPMFKILFSSKRFNVKVRTGETFPAIAAAQMGHVPMLELFLQAGADLNKSDDKGNTALMCAARNGKMDCVEFLLANKADVNKITKIGNALNAAVTGGHLDIVARLLRGKADVNAVIKREENDADQKVHWNQRALFIAVQLQNLKMTTLLLQAGAAVDMPVYESEGEGFGNVFDLAVHSETVELMKTLLNSRQAQMCDAQRFAKMKISALKIAVGLNRLEYFDLLAEGVDLNLLVDDELTLLQMACKFGNTNAVRKLLLRKVNINQCTSEGFTSLMTATLHGHTEIVRLLLVTSTKEYINDKDSRGETALMRACSQGHLECAELLLNAGASVDVKDNRGNTALIWAVANEKSAIIQLLAARTKLDLEARNDDGKTAIEMTIHPKIIQQLKSLGAKTDATTARAMLCLYLTFWNDVDRIRELLEVVDVNQGLNYTTTALPIFLLSNFRNLDIRFLVLKNKLYHDYPEINRNKIDKLADLLLKTCKEFSFSVEGSLCICITIRKVSYQLTLAKRGIQAFLADTVISEAGFEKLLQQRSEEGKALEEERKLKDLKEDALAQLLIEIRKVQKDWEVLEYLALLEKQHLGLDKETALLRKDCKLLFENLTLERNKLKEDLASNEEARIKSAIQRINDLGAQRQENITKKLSTLKSSLENTASGKQGLQKPSAARDKREKRKQQKEKKKRQTENREGTPSDKNQPEKKENEALNKSSPKVSETKALANVLETKEVSETKAWANALATELEKDQEQVALRTDVKPLGIPKILAESELPQLSPNYFDQADSIMKHDPLRLRPHTVGRASDVFGVLTRHQAKAGRATLSETVENLSALSLEPPQFEPGDKPAVHSMEFLININSSKGALAQAFETRKGLKEEWPARLRTILFKCEDGMQKLLDEQQVDDQRVIQIVCDICEKMTKISEDDLHRRQGKLSLYDIDVPLSSLVIPEPKVSGFLESLHDINIPPFEVKRADEMIKKSLEELSGFEKYIQEQREKGKGEELTKNPNFYMAIGWSLQRLCTYWKEIQDNDASTRSKYAAHLGKSRYGKYLPTFGQCYRHHDQAWKPAVRNFVQDCLQNPMVSKDIIVKLKSETNLRDHKEAQQLESDKRQSDGYTPDYSARTRTVGSATLKAAVPPMAKAKPSFSV